VTRLFDIAGGLVGLAVLGVISVPVALAIWFETGRPIFYKQIRSGRGGQPFLLYKFRTMLPDAEADGLARWAEPDDQRVTKIGWLLRKLRIDEMPQFWNVLKGEMSIIGPRPERPEFIQMLESRIPFYRARLLLKPGITGWAQVNYGYASSVDNTALKLEYDLFYIKQRSLLLDLLILWRTWITVLMFQGT
jgi:lipopolysaccharide/colanic/teichoic acid biosynthesis glycosyltransferase